VIHHPLTGPAIEAACRVHTDLGPGLLESVYEAALAHELTRQRIPFERQVPIPIIYRGEAIHPAFIADLILADQLTLELKSVESINPVHKKQLLTYLRLANKPVGLLINFNVLSLKDGITRIVNGLEDPETCLSPRNSAKLRETPREMP
jgi:GxxExxY protein